MLTGGVICLIAGIVGYFVSAPKMDVINSPLGQIAFGLSESSAREAQMWQAIYYGSICAIILGAILLIGGIIQQATKEQK